MTQLNESLVIWQRPEWPYFQWNSSALLDLLVRLRFSQGKLLASAHLFSASENSSAIAKDIEKNYILPLTKERLCGWQASLFVTGYSGVQKITVGDYRKTDFVLDSKQLIPPAKNINEEMKRFLNWWNDSPVGLDGIIRAGIAHFWFSTIAPFEDGNGRIARHLIDLALAQDEKTAIRLYDFETEIKFDEKNYLALLSEAQKKDGEITDWLRWFFEKILLAIEQAEQKVNKLSQISEFWKKCDHLNLSTRQKKILTYLLNEHYEEKKSTLSNKNFVEICKTSRESIKRDLSKLVLLGLIKRGDKKGRSTFYYLSSF